MMRNVYFFLYIKPEEGKFYKNFIISGSKGISGTVKSAGTIFGVVKMNSLSDFKECYILEGQEQNNAKTERRKSWLK